MQSLSKHTMWMGSLLLWFHLVPLFTLVTLVLQADMGYGRIGIDEGVRIAHHKQ